MTNTKFARPDGVNKYGHSETGLKDGTPAEPEKPSISVAVEVTPTVQPVPPGLFRCPVCNEYRGFIDIDDLSVHSRCKGDFLTVQCICDGILCPRCKINRIHRPISNVWSERGGFGHVPYFAAMGYCNECRAKREAEAAASKAAKREEEGSR
jgi:hypothetical protein